MMMRSGLEMAVLKRTAGARRRSWIVEVHSDQKGLHVVATP